MEDAQNIRTLQTMLRVIASTTGEIPPVVPDGIYGRQTAASVRAFQQAAGLPITGKVDEATWRSIITAYQFLAPRSQEPASLNIMLNKDATIGPGTDGGHVYLVQAMLAALHRLLANFPAVTVSGDYDAATEQAVRFFQGICRLPETGLVDRSTWQQLVSLYRLTVGAGIAR